ncbi:MAG: response regulator, partial [Planctomycetota bacterium]
RAALADMDTAGERADVLLSDLDLPDGTGHDLVRDLARDLDDTTQPLAVAFSGHGHEDDIRASHAAGFDEHLTKPIPPDVLLNTIRRLLAARPTLQSAS